MVLCLGHASYQKPVDLAFWRTPSTKLDGLLGAKGGPPAVSGCFHKWGEVLFVGVLITRALLFQVYDKLPSTRTSSQNAPSPSSDLRSDAVSGQTYLGVCKNQGPLYNPTMIGLLL